MLECSLRKLLEEVVNTSTKLTIVLLYANYHGLAEKSDQIARRVYRDVHSVENALSELAQDGILAFADGRYRLDPEPMWREPLQRLLKAYDEPLHRQELMAFVSELDRYAPYRNLTTSHAVLVN
jgi:hypothetical protein